MFKNIKNNKLFSNFLKLGSNTDKTKKTRSDTTIDSRISRISVHLDNFEKRPKNILNDRLSKMEHEMDSLKKKIEHDEKDRHIVDNKIRSMIKTSASNDKLKKSEHVNHDRFSRLSSEIKSINKNLKDIS